MSAVLIATLAGLVAAICWGTADWLSGKSAKSLSTLEVNFGVQVASGGLAVLLAIFTHFHLPSSDLLIRVAVGSALMTAGYMIFVKALSSGVVGIIVPIANGYPLILVFLSVLVLGESFSIQQFSAFLCIILGASFLAYEKNHGKIPLRELHRETLLAVTAAIVWGLAYFVIDPAVTKMSWQQLTVLSEFYITVIAFLLLLTRYRSGFLPAAKRSLSTPWPLLVGVTGTVGFASVYLGSGKAGSIVIPTVLSSCSSLVASLWGAVIDKEKIGIIKRLGAVILVAGIVILNLS